MKRIAVTGLILGSLFLAGCSSGDSGMPASNSEKEAPGAVAPAMPDRDMTSGTDGAAKEGAPQAADAPVAEARSLIYRGDISIRVEDVEIAAAKVEALATSFKGHLASEKRSLGNDSAFASITIRVPSDSFSTAMQRLSKEIGREESRSSNTEDVTEAVVDLDIRIASAKASEESVRRLLERPGLPLTEIIMLEKEVKQRQADLAVLEAKKRRLDDLVSLSTITINLAGPNTALPSEPKERAPGLMGGLEAGWDAFLTAGNALIYVLAYLLPFLVVIAVVAFGIGYLLRIRRNRLIPPGPPSTPSVYDRPSTSD